MILHPTPKNTDWKPVLFDLKVPDSAQALSALTTSNPTLEVIDEIHCQLEELVKLRHPKKKFAPAELQQEIKAHLREIPINEYGNWAYYPWLNKLVHVLGETEFVEVRTNRNHYKITPDEEEVLAQKKIGIIGLSVGKAIALTVALERICGSLVLADFDVIELSNLNRIQTGIQNFGLKKTIVVAREIAEIDPYLQVTCLHDGLTEENCNDFFTKDGKLDICIEVCDGLHSKIFARQKAKELGIAVVMNSSDRGTTDIERFDSDPSLPILHGLIDHLDLTLLKQAKTNEEKVPYLLPMLGVETSSERLKASMLEIEESITTWPQLASGVVLGAGICTDVCRRILLNQFSKSGRYFIDPEQHINDRIENAIPAKVEASATLPSVSNTTLTDFKDSIARIDKEAKANGNAESCALTKGEIETLVEHAIMAPSGGNTQPWKWLHRNNSLFLFNDINRSHSVLNYRNFASLISHGAATENLILKAHQMGYEVETVKFPHGADKDLIAQFSFYKSASNQSESHSDDHLMTFVPSRITNRRLGERISIPKDALACLENAVKSIDGAQLKLFTNGAKIDELKAILIEIDRLFLTNKAGHSHFNSEIKWNQKEAEETRDGVDLKTIDITPTEEAGLIVSKNWDVTKHIKQWNLGSAFGKLSTKAIDSASALGMVTMPKSDANHFYDGGRAVQKLWLSATQQGIAFQPISINTFLFKRVNDNNFGELDDVKNELTALREKFIQSTKLSTDEEDIFFFRISQAQNPIIKSLRRHTKDILTNE